MSVCVRKFSSTKDLLSIRGSKKNLLIFVRKTVPQSAHLWIPHTHHSHTQSL